MPFDVGRVSDLDVAVTGRQLLDDAEAAGIQMRSRGMRTAPVPHRVQRALGVADLLKDLTVDTGRPVKIMVYGNLPQALGHKPSIPLPKE